MHKASVTIACNSHIIFYLIYSLLSLVFIKFISLLLLIIFFDCCPIYRRALREKYAENMSELQATSFTFSLTVGRKDAIGQWWSFTGNSCPPFAQCGVRFHNSVSNDI